MPIKVDIDYSPYVYWVYGIAVAMLGAMLVWTVLRIARAHARLREAEREEKENAP